MHYINISVSESSWFLIRNQHLEMSLLLTNMHSPFLHLISLISFFHIWSFPLFILFILLKNMFSLFLFVYNLLRVPFTSVFYSFPLLAHLTLSHYSFICFHIFSTVFVWPHIFCITSWPYLLPHFHQVVNLTDYPLSFFISFFLWGWRFLLL